MVYSFDSVINTIHHNDKCQTIETSVCRKIPGTERNLSLTKCKVQGVFKHSLKSLTIKEHFILSALGA